MQKEFEKKQKIDFDVRFSDFKVLNPDFTRCRCSVFYTGKNRNYSNITQEALQKLIDRKGYANVPVIGSIKKVDGQTVMGGHDRKIEITDDEGIKIINECVPYGVIPESCNPAMEVITDVHGYEKEYFCVDVVLWTHYFPEIMESAGDSEIFFSQSMEIEVTDGSYDDKFEYYIIKDFSLQALCLLGRYSDGRKSTEPCFEDSVVKRFTIDDTFKQNFDTLLEKLKQYESDSVSKSVSHINNNSDKKGEMLKMDFSKILEKLSETKIENSDVCKYILIDVTDTAIGVLDREDYKPYSINYAIVEDEVVIDFESKTECKFSVAELGENDKSFNLMAEINFIKEDVANTVKNEVETSISATYAESYNEKITAITEQFEKLSEEHKSAMDELEKFRAEDARMKELAKKNEIDEIVNKFESQMNKYAAFMIWKANLDYSKTTPDDVNKELTLMLGKMTVDGTKKNETFSYKPTVTSVGSTSNKNGVFVDSERYGNFIDRVMNKD